MKYSHFECLVSPITARKQILGQGNVFRSMYQSFCPGGGGGSLYDVTSCLSTWCHVPLFLPGMSVSNGPMFLLEGLCPGGLCLQGVVSVQGGGSLSRGGFSIQGSLFRVVSVSWNHNQNSGQYASYWNAFVFLKYSWKCCPFTLILVHVRTLSVKFSAWKVFHL